MKKKKLLTENYIFLICIILLFYAFIYQFFLVKIPEFIKFGYETGIITYNLSMSIIASGIFYYLVVFLPEKKKKKKVSKIINYVFDQIDFIAIGTFGDILKSTGQKHRTELPKKAEEFMAICHDISLSSKPPDYFAGSATVPLNNWYEYFKYNFGYDDKHLDILQKHSTFLNPEIILLMHNLSSHEFRKAVNQYHMEYEKTGKEIKFNAFLYVFYDYLLTIKKFKETPWS
jgi:hypothetical protein